jgi:hypothetical protein
VCKKYQLPSDQLAAKSHISFDDFPTELNLTADFLTMFDYPRPEGIQQMK